MSVNMSVCACVCVSMCGDRASQHSRKLGKVGDGWGGVFVLLTGACRKKGRRHVLHGVPPPSPPEELCPSSPHPSPLWGLLSSCWVAPAPWGLLAHTGLKTVTSQPPTLSGFCSAQRDGEVLKGGCGPVARNFPGNGKYKMCQCGIPAQGVSG